MSNLVNPEAMNPRDTYVAGTITALNGTVSLTFGGHKSCSITTTGTWVGTLVVESSNDGGTTWVVCWLQSISAATTYEILRAVNFFTGNSSYAIFTTAGVTDYRVRASAWTSGTATIKMSATEAPPNALFATTSMIQNVLISISNNSTTNLAAGATFTGTSESTLGVAGVQVTLKTDQNCTVYVEQSPDGTNWDIVDSFNYKYTFGGTGWTVQAQSSFTRIRLTNIGASTTTYLRLQTALCPIVEAVPRTLDDGGNFKVCVKSIKDDASGFKVGISPMGELRVSEHVKLVGEDFAGTTLDTNFWAESNTGTGDAAVTDGEVVLSTGATANSTSQVTSVRVARYVGSYPNYYRGIVTLPAVTSTNVRRWGAFDANDGCFFEHDGTTLSIVTRKGTTDTKVSSGSFNGEEGAVYSVGTTINTYEIYFTNSSVWFYVGNSLIHKVSASSTPWASTNNLKTGLYIANSGGNTNNNSLKCRVMSINRIGKADVRPVYKYNAASGTTTLKTGVGTLHSVSITGGSATGKFITLYDNTAGSGTIITKIDTSSFGTYVFNLDFYVGLTQVVDAGAGENTVVYD